MKCLKNIIQHALTFLHLYLVDNDLVYETQYIQYNDTKVNMLLVGINVVCGNRYIKEEGLIAKKIKAMLRTDRTDKVFQR